MKRLLQHLVRFLAQSENNNRETPATFAPCDPLEGRVLLSGNVLATVLDGALQIVGDSRANNITITQPGNKIHQMRISAGAGTTVNGNAGTVILNNITNVSIRMNNGADNVTLRGLTISGDVKVAQGSADTLTFDDVDIARSLSIRNSSSLLTSTTTTTLLNTEIDRNLFMQTGPGGEDVTLQAAVVHGDTFIATGKRAANVTIDDSVFRREVQVFTGRGNDTMQIEAHGASLGSRTRFDGTVAIAMGAGDDILQFGIVGQGSNRVTFGNKTHVDGDGGTDIFRNTNASYVNPARIRSFEFSNAIPDTIAPTISSTDPANNAIGLALNRAIAATFSEPMRASTLSNSTVTVKAGSVAVAGTVAYVGTTMTFTPTVDLAASTVYTATITTGAKDAAGNALAQNKVWTFTTGVVADTTAPTVSSTDPIDTATGVALNKHISATFSEAIDPTTLNTTNVTVKAGSVSVAGTIAYVGSTMTFTPTSTLAASTVYTATITTGVKDLAGNALAANKVWTFTSGVTVDTTAPTVLSTDPADASTGIAVNHSVAATFSESIDPASVTLADVTVTGPGSAIVAGTLSVTGSTVVFTPTAALAASTLYTARITTNVKDLAGNFLAANKVWTFTTGVLADTTAPTITATSPSNTQTNVALNKSVGITFSEAMDVQTLTTASVQLFDPNSIGVNGTVTYNSTSHISSFTPTSNLATNTTYTARIVSGNFGVKDLAGNALASDLVFSFTTGTQVAQAPINLGSASTFAVMAATSIAGTGPIQINGDVGLNPGSSQGIPLSEINGTVHVVDTAVMSAQSDLLSAYNDAVNRSATSVSLAGNMGGLTFTPGLYTNSSSVQITGSNVTLDAQGDPNAIFIFQMGSTLTTGPGIHVVLAGGAKATNVFWQVGTSATLDTTTVFKGNILAAVSITVNNGSVIEGRLFAGTTGAGSITIDAATVTVPVA